MSRKRSAAKNRILSTIITFGYGLRTLIMERMR